MTKVSFRARAVYHLAKLLAPDLENPDVIHKAIAKDRKAGPQRPPRRLLKKLDFREDVQGGVKEFRARLKGAPPSDLRLLYIHGGGYSMDIQKIMWTVPVGLIERVTAEVVAPLYPLAPEVSWRETMAALKSHYLALAEACGAENIIVVGDSAGGGLTLLLAQLLRDEGLPQPRALLLFSPCLDLSGSGADQPALERRDPVFSLPVLHLLASLWAKDVPADDPRVSPLFASQKDLPPTIVFSGDREILHSDAMRLASVNPSIEHRSYPGMVHVWPGIPFLPEAKRALDEAADFVVSQVADHRL